MNKLALLISTCLGLGYTPKGGGTLAAIACCIAWYFMAAALAGTGIAFNASGAAYHASGAVYHASGAAYNAAGAAYHASGTAYNVYAYLPLAVTAILMAAGVWSSGRMEHRWGKDNYRIVVDEVVGMCCTLLFIPVRWPYVLTGLILFRFFDIVKPLYIRRLEGLKGGWGVMMDDVLAGLYSNLILQVVVRLKIL